MRHRVERHIINSNHEMFEICDKYCFKAKNIYNYSNYIIRQKFIDSGEYIRPNKLMKDIKTHKPFTDIGSNSAQQMIRLLDKDWKSFFKASKEYSDNPKKFLGKPNIPKYKEKNGRAIFIMTNRQTRIECGYLYFAFKPFKAYNKLIKTNVHERLMQTRIVPKGGCYVLELVYEVKTPSLMEMKGKIVGIDIGLNNFATIVNNIGKKPIVINGKGIKSYNQYWNKNVANYRSLAKRKNGLNWTKRLQSMTDKRRNKLDYFMHCASKYIIDYCKELKVDTIVVGYNEKWKQNVNLGVNTQSFVQVPHYEFLLKLKYKCEDAGINLVVTEESYTSGTSFVDKEKPIEKFYDKSRRVHRGLLRSNEGVLVNADVNAAYQIIKKVFPNVFANGIEGVDLHPTVVNL